jgi:hypothetical protein
MNERKRSELASPNPVVVSPKLTIPITVKERPVSTLSI